MNTKDITAIVKEVWPKISRAYSMSFNRECPVSLSDLKIAISTKGVLPGKIGRHIGPKDGYVDGSILILHPKVESSQVPPAYVKVVIAHELIHFALSRDAVKSHGPEFDSMADKISMPAKFRD